MNKQIITDQGDKITTHGVPAGYGYIRFASGHHLQYWPVRILESGYTFLKSSDGSDINWIDSRQVCVDFIKNYIDRQVKQAEKLQEQE